MDQQVLGALISTVGVATAVVVTSVVTARVALVSSRRAHETALAAAKQMAMATIESARVAALTAHNDGLWQERKAAYVALVGEASRRQSVLHNNLRRYRESPEWEAAQATALAEIAGVSWENQARVTAFASPAVLEADRAVDLAIQDAYNLNARWGILVDAARDDPNTPYALELRQQPPFGQRVQEAIGVADRANAALIDLIRAELETAPGLGSTSPIK